MADIEDYHATRKYETFSYLPAMSGDQLRRQIEYMTGQGWNPAIEHVHPERALNHYWHMWKLPMFGEDSVDVVIAELEACHRAHPNDYVRLIGYDNYTQSQGTAFVVYSAK